MMLLVYKHFGHQGPEAESFLSHQAKKQSWNVDGQQNTAEFLNYWQRLFSFFAKMLW